MHAHTVDCAAMSPSLRSDRVSILLAGGGTGGHIYPNVAIAEQLRTRGTEHLHFLVSNRPGDAKTMERLGEAYTASPMRPLPSLRRPTSVLPFLTSAHRSLRQTTELLRDLSITAVVATGGFVSGPAMLAAARLGIPRLLVNLDAIPGVANRQLARVATRVFSTYETPLLPGVERIGLPLRRVSVGNLDAPSARRRLELDPDRPTLFVTGATHGAESMIRTLMQLVQDRERSAFLRAWQIFHQCGTFDGGELRASYEGAGMTARVVDYCDEMGTAYAAADLVVSRSGAGSVAEAWANATPTIFLPNPYHKDQHQAHNAQPMADAGGAVLVRDEIEPRKTLVGFLPVLEDLCRDADRRERMREALTASRPPDGAAIVAECLCASSFTREDRHARAGA